jgi:hypothetical protein
MGGSLPALAGETFGSRGARAAADRDRAGCRPKSAAKKTDTSVCSGVASLDSIPSTTAQASVPAPGGVHTSVSHPRAATASLDPVASPASPPAEYSGPGRTGRVVSASAYDMPFASDLPDRVLAGLVRPQTSGPSRDAVEMPRVPEPPSRPGAMTVMGIAEPGTPGRRCQRQCPSQDPDRPPCDYGRHYCHGIGRSTVPCISAALQGASARRNCPYLPGSRRIAFLFAIPTLSASKQQFFPLREVLI